MVYPLFVNVNFNLIQGDDSETELRKQRGVIENLKQDRAHYRDEAEKLRLVGLLETLTWYVNSK